MLILLPPSEGKTAPRRGKPLDLDALAFAAPLRPVREAALRALEAVCAGPAPEAARVLGLPAGRVGEIERNRALRTAPTAPAARLYTGVLFEHLDLGSLDAGAKRRAGRSVLIASGLWGMVAPGDRLPAYRLSGGVHLPPLGGLAAHWRPALDQVVPTRAGAGLVLDLRSGTYASAWRPRGELAERTVTVRVTQNGRVVSHHNKATKGLLARSLLAAGVEVRTADSLAAACQDLGWSCRLSEAVAGRARELTVATA